MGVGQSVRTGLLLLSCALAGALSLSAHSIQAFALVFAESGPAPARVATKGSPLLTLAAYGDGRQTLEPSTNAPADDPALVARELVVAKGNTPMNLLLGIGIARADADLALRALGKIANLRKLAIGQRLTVYFAPRPTPTSPSALLGVALDQGAGRAAVAFRDFNNRFTARTLTEAEARTTLGSIVFMPSHSPEQTLITRDLVFKRGDNLAKLLGDAGASLAEIDQVAKALRGLLDLRSLDIGQRLTASFEPPAAKGKPARLIAVAFARGDKEPVVIGRQADNGFAEGTPDTELSTATTAANDPVTANAAPIADTDITEAVAATARDSADAPAAKAEKRAVSAVRSETGKTSRGDTLFEVGQGDTLMAVMRRAGVNATTADRIGDGLRRLYNPKRMYVGQKLVIQRAGGDGEIDLLVQTARDRAVVVKRDKTGRYVARRMKFDAFVAATQSATVAEPAPDAVARAAIDETGAGLADESSAPASKAARSGPSLTGASPPPKIRAALHAQQVAAGDDSRRADREPLQKTLVLARGDTLLQAMVQAGIDAADADAAVKAMRKVHNPRKLKSGQEVVVQYDTAAGASEPRVKGLSLAINAEKQVQIARSEQSGFTAKIVERETQLVAFRSAGTISSSLYVAAEKAGLPNPVLLDLIRLFSYDVDF